MRTAAHSRRSTNTRPLESSLPHQSLEKARAIGPFSLLTGRTDTCLATMRGTTISASARATHTAPLPRVAWRVAEALRRSRLVRSRSRPVRSRLLTQGCAQTVAARRAKTTAQRAWASAHTIMMGAQRLADAGQAIRDGAQTIAARAQRDQRSAQPLQGHAPSASFKTPCRARSDGGHPGEA